MATYQDIIKAYEFYSKKMDGIARRFPYDDPPQDFGWEHLEVHQDGKMCLVGTDRGHETYRKETYSLEELMYWIFRSYANSRAFRA